MYIEAQQKKKLNLLVLINLEKVNETTISKEDRGTSQPESIITTNHIFSIHKL